MLEDGWLVIGSPRFVIQVFHVVDPKKINCPKPPWRPGPVSSKKNFCPHEPATQSCTVIFGNGKPPLPRPSDPRNPHPTVQLHYVKHSLERIALPPAMAGNRRKEASPHHPLSHAIFLLRSRMLHATSQAAPPSNAQFGLFQPPSGGGLVPPTRTRAPGPRPSPACSARGFWVVPSQFSHGN